MGFSILNQFCKIDPVHNQKSIAVFHFVVFMNDSNLDYSIKKWTSCSHIINVSYSQIELPLMRKKLIDELTADYIPLLIHTRLARQGYNDGTRKIFLSLYGLNNCFWKSFPVCQWKWQNNTLCNHFIPWQEKNTLKEVSFSDFLFTFAMSLVIFACL